jgi:hypothetical protein
MGVLLYHMIEPRASEVMDIYLALNGCSGPYISKCIGGAVYKYSIGLMDPRAALRV